MTTHRLRLALSLLLAPLAAAQNHPQFAEMKLAETGALSHTQVLDVDVDGMFDVAAPRFSEPSGVLVARGLSDGSLAEPVVQPAHDTLQALRFADMDGDGLPDALVANRGSDDVSVLLGSAGGLLGAAHFAVPDQPLDLDAGDALVALATDADGELQIDTTWPAGLPSGTRVWLQAWISDAGAVHGVAATRGLQVTTP